MGSVLGRNSLLSVTALLVLNVPLFVWSGLNNETAAKFKVNSHDKDLTLIFI